MSSSSGRTLYVPFTDAGTAPLANMKNLKTLSLLETEAGDATLEHLAGLSKLATANWATSRNEIQLMALSPVP